MPKVIEEILKDFDEKFNVCNNCRDKGERCRELKSSFPFCEIEEGFKAVRNFISTELTAAMKQAVEAYDNAILPYPDVWIVEPKVRAKALNSLSLPSPDARDSVEIDRGVIVDILKKFSYVSDTELSLADTQWLIRNISENLKRILRVKSGRKK